MPLTHNPSNVNGIIDWTEEINEIDNLFGFIRANGDFNIRTTASSTILFDRIENQIRLIPATNPRANDRNVGKDRDVTQYAMALQYYSDDDYIDVQDIQDQRRPGMPDTEETFASVRAIKLEDLRFAHDQTDEYLRFNAMVGNLPAGAVAGASDMYDVFGLNKAADFTVALDAGNASVDLDAKFAEVKRKVAEGYKAGTAVSGVDFYVSQDLFDQILANPKFREVYQYYVNSGQQRLRDENMDYYRWGVVDFFEHRGVRVMAYNPTFVEADGTEVQVLGALEGVAVPRGTRDLFRGYHGPANKLSLANQGGQELFAFEFTDQADQQHTIQTQARKLYWATKPAAIIQLTSS